MVKNFLITRPKHDIPTSYLHDFSKGIIKTVKEISGIHLTNLESDSANRKNFENHLVKERPSLVFLNGHGDKKSVWGHENEVIFDEKNVFLTKEKIIYALACDSLESLGKIAVEHGAKAYIGYKARFMLVINPTRSTSLNKDNNALPFKKACSILITLLISGHQVAQAIELTKKEYASLIQSIGTSKDDPYGDVPLIRFALAWNLEFLGVYGDSSACF